MQLTVGSILPSTPELNEDISSRSLSSQASDSGIYPAYDSSHFEPSAHDSDQRNFAESFEPPPQRLINSNIGSVRSYVQMLNYKNKADKKTFYDTHHFNKMILSKLPNYSQEEVNKSTLELKKIISKFEKISNKPKGFVPLKNSQSEINLSKNSDKDFHKHIDSFDLRRRVVNEFSEIYLNQNQSLLKHKSYSDIPQVVYNFTNKSPTVGSLRVPTKDRASPLKAMTLEKSNFDMRPNNYSHSNRKKSKVVDSVFVQGDRNTDAEFRLRPLPFPDYSDLHKLERYQFKIMNKANGSVKLEMNSPDAEQMKLIRRNGGIRY